MTIRRDPADLDERAVEALLRGRSTPQHADLGRAVATLQALAQTTPAPSASLAAMLEDGFTPAAAGPAPTAQPRRRARVLATIGASITLLLGGIVGAAAANALPAPIQRVVASAINAVTSLHLPRPAGPGQPAGTNVLPGTSPSPHVVPVNPTQVGGPTVSAPPTSSSPTDPFPTPRPEDSRDPGHSGGPTTPVRHSPGTMHGSSHGSSHGESGGPTTGSSTEPSTSTDPSSPDASDPSPTDESLPTGDPSPTDEPLPTDAVVAAVVTASTAPTFAGSVNIPTSAASTPPAVDDTAAH